MLKTHVKTFPSQIAHWLVVLFLVWPQLNWAAPTCEALFPDQAQEMSLSTAAKLKQRVNDFMARFEPQKLSDKMVKNLFNAVKDIVTDLTSKRVENKVTAATEVVDAAFKRFEKKLKDLNIPVVLRDEKTEGRRNVTYTEYSNPFSATITQLQAMGFAIRPELLDKPNGKINVKLRARSYGTVDSKKSEFSIEDIEFASFTKDRAFVELKFKDPSYEGAAFKPQLYMKKEYIKLFGTPEFLLRFEEIKADTLANRKISSKKTLNEASVTAMLEFIRQAHIEELNLKVVAINLYERTAKSVLLMYNFVADIDRDPNIPVTPMVELQITFDQLIALYLTGDKSNLGEGTYYRSYSPDETVSEFKTPTFVAHHLKRAAEKAKELGREGYIVSPEQAQLLDQVMPGFKDYIEMIDEIIQMRDKEKQLNRGKWGIALQKVRQDIEGFLTNFLNNYELAP